MQFDFMEQTGKVDPNFLIAHFHRMKHQQMNKRAV